MIAKVTDISWDITGMDDDEPSDLPNNMIVEVDDDLSRNDILSAVSQRVESLTGFHPVDFKIDV